MNNIIKITVASPLLRPGLSIETEVSSKYAIRALDDLMDIVRQFNEGTPPTTVKEMVDRSRVTRKTNLPEVVTTPFTSRTSTKPDIKDGDFRYVNPQSKPQI